MPTDEHTPHLDRAYELELAAIVRRVAEMSALAEQMVRDAVRALLDRDAELARQVQESDERLDRLEIAVDELCIALLARRAPVAGDLRMVTATLKLVTDLERIGDLAVNVGKRSIQIGAKLQEIPDEVVELGQAVIEELVLSLLALATRDSSLARRLRDEDQATDARNRAAFDRLLTLSSERPDGFEDLLALTNICRHLERIGDHAVNVAEMVIYMVDGKVVRHRPEGPTQR